MSMKIAAAALLAGVCVFNVMAAPAAAGPIKIGAIYAVTGPASNLGAPEQKTTRMLVDEINAKGGIAGHKIVLIMEDSKSDPTAAISLANKLIEQDKVLAIIGPSTSGETMKIKNICEENKTILISCAAAEDIVNPLAKYVFKVPQKDSQAAQKIFDACKAKGIKKVGVLASNTGFGNGGVKQLTALAPASGITLVATESYDKSATDLTAALAKIKAAGAEAVVNWSIEPAQSIVCKNMKQMAFNVPLFQSHGFGNIRYAKEAGEAAEGVIFPCGRLVVAADLAETHPQKKVLMKYKADYEGMFKEDASTFGGHPYDALLILTRAIETAGSTDPEKVRDAIENIKGLVGTAGTFNFSPADHNGLDISAFEMCTVKGGKFVVYSGK